MFYAPSVVAQDVTVSYRPVLMDSTAPAGPSFSSALALAASAVTSWRRAGWDSPLIPNQSCLYPDVWPTTHYLTWPWVLLFVVVSFLCGLLCGPCLDIFLLFRAVWRRVISWFTRVIDPETEDTRYAAARALQERVRGRLPPRPQGPPRPPSSYNVGQAGSYY